MKNLKIHKYPDPILTSKCIKVEKINDSILNQVDEMLDLMYKSGGIGLAANQAGFLNRVFVMDCSEDHDEPSCFINPIIKLGRGEAYIKEGCLSFPGIEVLVKRHDSVQVNFLSINGTQETKVFKDLEAICVQHEIDHLDGITFLERVNRKERRTINKKMRKSI